MTVLLDLDVFSRQEAKNLVFSRKITNVIYVLDGVGGLVFNGLNQDSFYIWRPCLNYGHLPEDINNIVTQEVPIT